MKDSLLEIAHASIKCQGIAFKAVSLEESYAVRPPAPLDKHAYNQLHGQGLACIASLQLNEPFSPITYINFNDTAETCVFMRDNAGKAYNLYGPPIGKGIYAEVYVGIDMQTGTPCTAKLYHRYKLQTFNHEKLMVEKINRFLGLADLDKKAVLFQKYKPGIALNSYLYFENGDPKEIPFLEKLTLCQSIIKKLIKLHKTLMHGDISLKNILYDNVTGKIHFCDFGFSQPIDFDGNQTSGSLFYNSPERFNGTLLPASEVYSLSVLLAMVFLSRNINQLLDAIESEYQQTKNFKAIRSSFIKRLPEPEQDEGPNWETLLWQTIRSCLAEDPQERPTLEELLSCIEKVADQAASEQVNEYLPKTKFIDLLSPLAMTPQFNRVKSTPLDSDGFGAEWFGAFDNANGSCFRNCCNIV